MSSSAHNRLTYDIPHAWFWNHFNPAAARIHAGKSIEMLRIRHWKLEKNSDGNWVLADVLVTRHDDIDAPTIYDDICLLDSDTHLSARAIRRAWLPSDEGVPDCHDGWFQNGTRLVTPQYRGTVQAVGCALASARLLDVIYAVLHDFHCSKLLDPRLFDLWRRMLTLLGIGWQTQTKNSITGDSAHRTTCMALDLTALQPDPGDKRDYVYGYADGFFVAWVMTAASARFVANSREFMSENNAWLDLCQLVWRVLP